MTRKKISFPVPSFFYSFDTNAPFVQCTMCNGELQQFSKYFIEKVFKQNRVLNKSEIVYEYAICESCASSMTSEISNESKMLLLNYIRTVVRIFYVNWIIYIGQRSIRLIVG